MTTWVPGGRSPDRMDALVWAMSRLVYPRKDDRDEIVTADDDVVRISPF
jgi:phage terminase large subunit-like protein